MALQVPDPVKQRARVLLEAYLRGLTQRGRRASPETIRTVYRIALVHARKEASECTE